MIPREVIVYGPGEEVFRKADYPWMRFALLYVKAGDGGASSSGEPGGKGQDAFRGMTRDEIPDECRVVVGRGGRGAPGAEDGQDGAIVIELYDKDPNE